MQNRNWILLGIAALVGLFAVLLANAWFSGVEQQQGGPTGEQKLSRIVVATQPLEFGARLTGQNVRLQDWPEASVPQGAFRSVPDALKDNRVAIRPIVPGEPVLASKVSGTDGRATLAALLPAGMRAMSLPVDAVSGVSGFVLPGSMVDVILTRKISGDAGSREGHRSDVILESVQVLAVDQQASDKQTEPKVARTATVAVSLYDAQRLVLAQQAGSLSLVLRKPSDADVGDAGTARPTRSVTLLELGGAPV
ncbi:MAG: Flp pilus assembly protein CpaB, partial [Pseudomonadota bacterium]